MPVTQALLDELAERKDSLYKLRSLLNAITITSGGISRPDPRAQQVQGVAALVEAQVEAAITGTIVVRRLIQQVRWEEVEAARRAENDRLGIPNCDHLIYQADCVECNKLAEVPPEPLETESRG